MRSLGEMWRSCRSKEDYEVHGVEQVDSSIMLNYDVRSEILATVEVCGR